jgi:hypothetical protein
MQLRKHPLLSYRGSPVWPPIWVSVESGKKAHGEVGLLNQVRCYPDQAGEAYLIIDHEGAQYAGCLLLDDKIFCEQLGNFLRNCCGMRIKEIGNLEIPPGFEVAKPYRKVSGW